jgi:hypothetical protein
VNLLLALAVPVDYHLDFSLRMQYTHDSGLAECGSVCSLVVFHIRYHEHFVVDQICALVYRVFNSHMYLLSSLIVRWIIKYVNSISCSASSHMVLVVSCGNNLYNQFIF